MGKHKQKGPAILEFSILSKIMFSTKFNQSMSLRVKQQYNTWIWSNLKLTNKQQYLTTYDKVENPGNNVELYVPT